MVFPLPDNLRLFMDAASIQARAQELGRLLSRSHRDRNPLIIGLLSGAFMFMADLIRSMDISMDADFWRLASYGHGTTSTGYVKELGPLVSSVQERHVIVVEDIVDTGRTIAHVRSELERRSAASVTVVALLQSRRSSVPIDHVGFRCGPRFVVGYGLDLGGQFRNLPGLYYLDH